MRKTRSEAHHLWKFLEKIYEDESENEDEEEESLEVVRITGVSDPRGGGGE